MPIHTFNLTKKLPAILEGLVEGLKGKASGPVEVLAVKAGNARRYAVVQTAPRRLMAEVTIYES